MTAEKITANAPANNGLWAHKESGTAYMTVSVSNLDATNPEFVPTVTYRCVEYGKLWSRPLHEFNAKFRFVGMPIMKKPELPDAKVVLASMSAAGAARTSLENVQDVLDTLKRIGGV